MSKPSFSNIDLWLFEYAEGNLTDSQVAQLELFILQHPELDVDRDMWEMTQLQQKDVVYEDEASLYKRTPVSMFWAVGGGIAAMFTLLFVGYSFFLQDDEIATNQNRLELAQSSTESYAYHMVTTSASERALKEEVADLKVLVASLENELRRSRGGNQLAFVENMEPSNNAEKTGVDNGNFRELRALNATSVGNVNANATNNGIANNATIAANGNTVPNNTSGNTTVSEPIENSNTFENSLVAMPGLKPNLLDELVVSMHPVSRDLFENDGDAIAQSQGLPEKDKISTLSVNYEDSYKYKLSRIVRNIRRMANNPIALKNYRDAYHHVPGMTATDINFGATGTMIAPRFQAMSRLQNRGASNELFSNQIGFDGYVFGMRGGVGVQMTHNYYNNGGIQSGEVAITYSPKLSVNQKLSFEPALRFKMGNKMLDANRMEGTSQVEFIPGNAIDYYADGTTPVGNMLWYRDLGLGLNVNTEWFYASAQIDNIFRHRDNIYSNDLTEKRRAGTYFVATLGTDWESNDSQWETRRSKFSLSPYLVYRNYEDINELWAGANFRAYWLTVGAAVSSNMDPSASLGIVSSDKRFSLTYNADYSRSIVTNERSLSHQLTLRLVGKNTRVGRRH
ncbi:MAG: hypothetical protein Crog4KO_06050 [Crocinitomicaceae bacterium]